MIHSLAQFHDNHLHYTTGHKPSRQEENFVIEIRQNQIKRIKTKRILPAYINFSLNKLHISMCFN